MKDPVPRQDKCGVYSLSCGQCPATYIGQTGRSIGERQNEHFSAHRNNAPHRSAFARHLLEAGHLPQNAHMELLHQASKGRLLNKLEEAAIVESLGDGNIDLVNNVQFNMFDNFINYIYKNDNDDVPVQS